MAVDDSDSSLKAIIKAEYKKCAQDATYFFKKYGMIQHNIRGRINFNLFKFQERTLFELMAHDYNIILKSRQMGISTLTAGYALWTMLFHADKNILVIATKQEVAKNIVDKVRFMFDNLPSWLKIECIEDNKLSLRLNNGSRIKAISSASDSGRSESVSMLIVDEAAFIDDIENIWGSAQQTLANGGKAIILSTPNGVGNFFHKTWTKAEAGENPFNTIRLHWSMHPERDQSWRDAQDELLGPRLAAQECFSGDTRIFTKYGMKPISEIKIGDWVLTHDGTFKKVLRTIDKMSDEVFEIYSNSNRIKRFCTPNHPFYMPTDSFEDLQNIPNDVFVRSIPLNIEWNKKSYIADLKNIIDTKYFDLKIDLADESFVYINDRRFKTRHKRFIEFDYDLGYIVGLYLAEGCKNDRRIVFSFNYATELNDWPKKIIDILFSKFGIEKYSIRKKAESSGDLEISSVILSTFLSKLIDGNRCYNKKLSNFAYEKSNVEFLKGVLDGVFVGDGNLTNSGANKSIGITSQDIMYDIKYISSILGYNYNTLRTYTPPKQFGKWEKYNYRDVYHLSFLRTRDLNAIDRNISSIINNDMPINEKSSHKNDFKIEEKYFNSKIYKEKKILQIPVYNLEVEDNNTYVTEHAIVHNCDANFNSSGKTVVPIDTLEWYRKTFVREPLEKREIGADVWMFVYPVPGKNYIVSADTARGDAEEMSAFHIFDLETLEQCVEYRGLLDTNMYGDLLIEYATKYNDAVLVIENNGMGLAPIQRVISRGYRNLFYTTDNLKYLDPERQYSNKLYSKEKKAVAGLTTSMTTRPLMINKLEHYFYERGPIIHGERTISELETFVWKGNRAEHMDGYTDDLCMSLAFALWVRDVALQFQVNQMQLVKANLDNFQVAKRFEGLEQFGPHITNEERVKTQWTMQLPGGNFDLKELL